MAGTPARTLVGYARVFCLNTLDVPVRAAHQLANAYFCSVVRSIRILQGGEDPFECLSVDDLPPDGFHQGPL